MDIIQNPDLKVWLDVRMFKAPGKPFFPRHTITLQIQQWIDALKNTSDNTNSYIVVFFQHFFAGCGHFATGRQRCTQLDDQSSKRFSLLEAKWRMILCSAINIFR